MKLFNQILKKLNGTILERAEPIYRGIASSYVPENRRSRSLKKAFAAFTNLVKKLQRQIMLTSDFPG